MLGTKKAVGIFSPVALENSAYLGIYIFNSSVASVPSSPTSGHSHLSVRELCLSVFQGVSEASSHSTSPSSSSCKGQ